jgi:hypothetical protein
MQKYLDPVGSQHPLDAPCIFSGKKAGIVPQYHRACIPMIHQIIRCCLRNDADGFKADIFADYAIPTGFAECDQYRHLLPTLYAGKEILCNIRLPGSPLLSTCLL